METNLLNEELEKIDVVRERTGLSFVDAQALLVETNWDVMEALVLYEQEEHAYRNSWEVRGHEVVDKVKEIFKAGNITNIRIKSNERTIMELPVTVGVIGAVLAPKLAVLAAATCLLSKCTIEFDRVQSKSNE